MHHLLGHLEPRSVHIRLLKRANAGYTKLIQPRNSPYSKPMQVEVKTLPQTPIEFTNPSTHTESHCEDHSLKIYVQKQHQMIRCLESPRVLITQMQGRFCRN